MKSNQSKSINDYNASGEHAFLFAWNPKYYPWQNVQEMLKDPTDFNWLCWTRNIPIGSRVFFIRLGDNVRGIVGTGRTTSESYPDKNYKDESKISRYCDIKIDFFQEMPVISYDDLPRFDKTNKKVMWSTRASGIRLPEDIAEWLAVRLSNNNENFCCQDNDIPEEIPEIYREGKAIGIFVNKYERDQNARAECIKHWGDSCSACGINLKDIYGHVADHFIMVHHLRPIASIGKEYIVDAKNDLRPVCPNCHAVIHRRNPPYSIDEIKSMINDNRQR